MTTSEEVAAKASFFTGVGAFPDAEVERAYQHAYFLRSLRPVRAAIALAIGLFVLFSALDPFLQPDAYFGLWIVRLAIVVPILGALLAFTYTRRFESWFRPSQLFAVVFGGSAIVYLGVLSSGDLSTAQVVGLLLAILWAHSVSRLSFMLATSATVMLSLLYVAVELRMGRLPATALLNNIFFLASANLIGMIASYSLEAGYRREFQQRALLEERRRELQGSLDRLHDAERRVSELELRAPDSLENLPRWAEQVSSEIRRTVEAAEVRIFRSADGKALALNDGDLTAPTLEDMNAGEMAKDASGNVLVPLTGLTGEVFGAIMIAQPASWSAAERGLVAGFARYLGGALEILEKRHELAIEEARRETARRQMRERGVGAMWLCPTCGRCFDDSIERCDVDGTRLVQRLLPYRIQGRYKLLRLLGQGGMGQVFLACDEKLQRDVAIKVLLGESPLDANARAQLAHEARAVARIGHPGVVDVFDLGELDDGSAFIVMEYLIGRALSEEIARHGRGSPRQVAELLRQVGAALAAAHRTGVVHRDIKPQNVFLTRHADGFHARLLDFGVARVAGGGADTTRSGALFGTPAYMAPEQIGGAAGDERSDLYSLAAVAFEALVGRRLIKQRPSVAATLAAILNEQPPDVSTFLKDVPPDLDGLFRSALSRDPAARPPNVADWADAVAQRLDGMTTTEGIWPLPITHELTMRGQPVDPR